MNLIRKLKISKISNQPLTGVYKEIVDFINSKLTNLIPFQMDDDRGNIYHMNSEGLCLLIEDKKDDELWFRYYGFWDKLENKYFISRDDTQLILHYMSKKLLSKSLSIVRINFATKTTPERLFKEKMKIISYSE